MERNCILFTIDGMMCMKNCGSTVQRVLRDMPNVQVAHVVFERKLGVVFVPETVNRLRMENEITEQVESIGFEIVEMDPVEYTGYHMNVEGMMCTKNCGSTVIRAVKSVEHVVDCIVDLDGKAICVVCEKNVNHDDLVDAVDMVGFDTEMWTAEQDGLAVENRKLVQVNSGKVEDRKVTTNDQEALLGGMSCGSEEVCISMNTSRAFYNVGGMSCAACVKSIENVLTHLEGVEHCKVGLIAQKAEVFFDPNVIQEQEIQDEIIDAGYDAVYVSTIQAGEEDSREIKLSIQGMTCSACVGKVEKTLAKLNGVVSVAVNLPLHRAIVHVTQHSETGARTLIESINSLGYSGGLASKTTSGNDIKQSGMNEVQKWKNLLRNAVLFAAPAMIVHMILPYIPPANRFLMTTIVNHLTIKCLVMWILATPVQFGIGKRFYVAAYKGLQHGMMGMDFLIVVGTTASYMYSFVSMMLCAVLPSFSGHYFFESSVMLITFVTFGKYLESLAKGRTVDALSHLVDLQPKFALLVKKDENGVRTETEISIEMVERGDMLRVAPGASVPTDGIIIDGTTTVDESMITGESMPIVKKAGDHVFGSTINQHGTITIQSKCCGGGDSALSQICSLIEEAQVNKAPIQAYADHIASIFAPVVLTIAAMTFIVWYVLLSFDMIPEDWKTHDQHDNFLFALLFSISVVVIACPCALGLATPTAVMVGCGVGAQNGILIKGGSSLETANSVDTVIFDKTGTLTMGKPSVTDVIALNKEWTPKEMLYFVASAEGNSEHPLGKAIVLTATEQEKITLSNSTGFIVKPGRGLVCNVDDKKVHVGNFEWMQDNEISIEPKALGIMNNLEADGKTVVCVAVDTVFIGLIAMADIPRNEARCVISALHAKGIHVWMITGDNLRTATAIAKQMNIDHVKAVALPGEKVNQIKMLQSQGRVVAMVGDGINDAPALAQSDVGLAIGAGTEIAVAQADMILVKSNLRDVVTALDLASVVFSRIRLNFMFSIGYNLLGIPIAAGLFYPLVHTTLPPVCAGLAMAFSSVSVVLSSLSLKSYRAPDIMQHVDALEVKTHTFASKSIDLSSSGVSLHPDLPSVVSSKLHLGKSSKYQKLETQDSQHV